MKACNKVESGGSLNYLSCNYDGQREIHIGMHTVIGMAICPIPKLASLSNNANGNTSDDSSPIKVHRSGHDVNGGVKMNVSKTSVLLNGMA